MEEEKSFRQSIHMDKNIKTGDTNEVTIQHMKKARAITIMWH